MEYSHFLVSHRTTAELSFCQIFNQHTYHLQPTNYFIVLHGTGLNVPVLKRLISIIQPCPRYKVKCPCVGHTHEPLLIQPSSVTNQLFNGVQSPFHLGNAMPKNTLQIFSSFYTNSEAREYHSSVSFGAYVNYIFGWVVHISSLYIYILVLYIGGV